MRHIVCCAALCVLASSGSAQTVTPPPPGNSWLDKSYRIMEEAERTAPPAWLSRTPDDATVDRAKQLLGDQALPFPRLPQRSGQPEWVERSELQQALTTSAPVSQPPEGESDAALPDKFKDKSIERTYVLVSLSIPEPTLREIMRHAAESHAYVVVRGVVEGESIDKLMARLNRIAKGLNPYPAMLLDPVLFTEAGIATVPAVIVTQHDKFVKLRGAISISYAREQFRQGKTGDLGRFGETFDIAERDLIEELKSRIEELDWEAKAAEAEQSFVSQLPSHMLPPARQTTERVFDPSVLVTQDIYAPDGRLLAARGSRINPAAQIPFDRRVVIFDGMDPQQVAFAAREVTVADSKYPVILITTRFDRQEGLQGLEVLMTELNQNVFLLFPDFRERFGVERLPTVIFGRGDKVIIREVAL